MRVRTMMLHQFGRWTCTAAFLDTREGGYDEEVTY